MKHHPACVRYTMCIHKTLGHKYTNNGKELISERPFFSYHSVYYCCFLKEIVDSLAFRLLCLSGINNALIHCGWQRASISESLGSTPFLQCYFLDDLIELT